MPESIHEKLKRVRKPHVHITMDIDGDGLPVRELPFVAGVMGDFVGDPDPLKPPPLLKERKFIEINRDNFNDVMKRLKPGLSFRVKHTLTGKENEETQVDLKFESIEDFDPGRVVEQVPMLKQLLETRRRLEQLKSAVDRSKGGDRLLEQILQDADKLTALSEQVKAKPSQAPESGGEQ